MARPSGDWILSPSSRGTKGVGYTDVVEAFLPYRNAIKMFLPIFDLKKISYFKILISLRKNMQIMKILLVLICYMNYLSYIYMLF
jgi:hypothetical protein